MWTTVRALALVLLVLAMLAPPTSAEAGTPGAPLGADAASTDPEAGTPFAALFEAVRSWWQTLRATPEDAEPRSVTGSSGHHMDPNGSAESEDSEARRAGEPALPAGGPGSVPEVL